MRVTSRHMFPERILQKSTSLSIWVPICWKCWYANGTLTTAITVATVDRHTPKNASARIDSHSRCAAVFSSEQDIFLD